MVGPATGLAAMVLTGVGVWAIAVQIRSRRSMGEADDLPSWPVDGQQALAAPPWWRRCAMPPR